VVAAAAITLVVVDRAGARHGAPRRQAYVLLTAPERGPLIVSVDGKQIAKIAPSWRRFVPTFARDVDFGIVDLTADAPHVLDVRRAGENTSKRFTIDPRATEHGWVIAPDAESADLCLVEAKVVYARDGATRDTSTIRKVQLADDVVALPQAYEAYFVESPRSVRLESHESVKTRFSLHAIACSTFDADAVQPYAWRSSSARAAN